MPAPSILQLEDRNQFELLLTIKHANIAAQIQPLIFSLSPITVAYWFVNVAALALIGVLLRHADISLLESIPTVCLGVTATWLLVLPVHEYIHGFAYRACGAQNVSVHYQLGTLTAHCLADRFVVGAKAFAIVCLAPSILINSALLLALATLPSGSLQLALSGGLLLHIAAASGDVALCNALWQWRKRKVWTYDDAAAGESYFFAERSST